MPAGPLSPPGEPPAPAPPPRCVFVTGPRGAGKTRWLQAQIRRLGAGTPGARAAVLLAEEGRTRLEAFAADTPGVTVHRLLLPCICCPGRADLPGELRRLVAAARPDWVFLEVPALAAAALVAEFDRQLGWPRELTVCLDRAWSRASEAHALSPFLAALLEGADRVVPAPPGGGEAPEPYRRRQPDLSL